MTMVITNWSELSSQPPSMEAIKSLHHPNEDFVFRRGAHERGARSLGGTSRTYIYGTKGVCRYWAQGESEEKALLLNQGQRMWLPEAPVNFHVGEDSDFEYVVVLELPEDLRSRGFQ